MRTVLYPFCAFILLIAFVSKAAAFSPYHGEDPVNPPTDSLARAQTAGHLRCDVRADTNCVNKTIRLQAIIRYLFTGEEEPVTVPWNTGQIAQSIIVNQPGTYTWETTGIGCDHFMNTIDVNPFFTGTLNIVGPPAVCPGEISVLTVDVGGYDFWDYDWSPENPSGDLSPFEITAPGNYSLTVVDQNGCPTVDNIVVPLSPPVLPIVTAPQYICPENDTIFATVVQNYTAYEWDNGSTTNPLMITEPGLYQVTVTNSFGCTGVGVVGVTSGAPDNVAIQASKPAICSGQLDTLQVIGAFLNYTWSTGQSGNRITVTQPGTYTVTVTSIQGCTGTATVTINPLPTPTLAVNAPPICPGTVSVLSVSGVPPNGQYTWSTGATTSTIVATMTGVYTVTITGNGFCTATASGTVGQNPNAPTAVIGPPGLLNCDFPQINLSGTGSSFGAPYVVNWSAQSGGNIVSGQNSLNPLVNAPGTYILSILDSTSQCTAYDTVQVQQNTAAPPANAGNPAILTCDVTSLTIGPSGTPDPNLNFMWSTVGGNIVSGDSTLNPVINQPGQYIITVTSSINGCTSTASVNIGQNITPPTVAIAQPDTLTCVQTSVTLNGSGSSSGPEFSYQWTTTNGTIVSGNNSPQAVAVVAGLYCLNVTNTNTGCASSFCSNLAQNVDIPIATAIAPDTITCTVQTVQINGAGSSTGSNMTYTWTTSGGNIVSGGNTLNPMVGLPGQYNLLVYNNDNDCSASYSVQVGLDIIPPQANAGVPDTLSCALSSLQLDGSASSSGATYTYMWTTGNGNILSGNNTPFPLVNTDGIYNLVVTNTKNGCTASSSVQIFNDVNAPVAAIAPPAELNCQVQSITLNGNGSSQGANLTIQWTGPTGGIVNGLNTLTPEIVLPGTYTLQINNIQNGCTDIQSVQITQDIATPDVNAGVDALINCFNPTATIGSAANPTGANFVYTWLTPDGNFVSGNSGPTPLVDDDGVYQLTITNTDNGCSAVDVVNVQENFTPPTAEAGNPTVLNCVQTSLNLQGTASGSANLGIQWSTTNGNIVSGNNTLTPLIDNDGLYTLLVTNNVNGCTATDQVNVTLDAVYPVASAGQPQTLNCNIGSVQLNGTGSSTGTEYTYNWTTPNGNIVNGGATTTPTVDEPGTYTITVVNTLNSCTSTATVQVVEDVVTPVVNAGPNDTLTCSLTNLSLQAQVVSSASNNLTYTWAAGPGQIISGGNTLTPLVGAIGTYTITVVDNQNGCTSSSSVQILADVNLPVATIAIPQILTCTLQQTTLNAVGSTTGNGVAYQWGTQGGNIVNQNNILQPVVDAPGVYTITVNNTLNGCSSSYSITVTENIQPPVAEAGLTAGLNCTTTTLSLNGAGSTQGPNIVYQWSTANGQIISGNNTLTPLIGNPGLYVLTVTDNANGCTHTDNVTITEDVTLPGAVIAPPQLFTCLLGAQTLNTTGSQLGSAPQFTWAASNGGNIVSGGNTLTPTVNEPGTYALTVTNTVNGCTTTVQTTVSENVTPPTLQTAPAPLLTCTVLQVTLNSIPSTQTQIQWSTSNGQIVSGANSANPVVNEPGLYAATVTSTVNGCTTTGQISVGQETNLPTGFDLAVEEPACGDQPGFIVFEEVLGGVGPYTYSVDGGATFLASSEFLDLGPGTYDLVVRDANGCEFDQAITFVVPLEPDVDVIPEITLEFGETQTIEALLNIPLSQVDTIIWSPTEGLEFTNKLNVVKVSTYKRTEYTVTVINNEGCEDRATVLVKVEDPKIWAPNVFSPTHRDGDNDYFLIFAGDNAVNNINSLQIYDRWGNQVFKAEDIQPNDQEAGWDGTYRSKPMQPGVFVWWADVEMSNGKRVLLKGDVTILD